MSVVFLIAIIIVPLSLLFVGFLVGRRQAATMTFPWRLIFQLIEHRQNCLEQSVEEISAELNGCFGISQEVWEKLAAAWEGESSAGDSSLG